ncbi:unnamed protein product, partial [Candidula unifasciata]
SSQENLADEQSPTPVLYWENGKPTANGPGRSCLCGREGVCGGSDSSRGQRTRLCNCDARDNKTKSDAGIIDNKDLLPLDKIVIGENVPYEGVIITVSDLYCAQKPLHDNECAGWNSCPHTATCVNTPGSYYCTCNSGYLQTGPTSCQDINECANSNLSNCDTNAHCENLDGAYRCICNRGFQGDGHSCAPVGECFCFGDTHCRTYDGRWLDVQGINEYVLSQDGCSPGEPRSFRITIQTWKKGGTRPGHYSYIRSVLIYSSKVIRLDQGGQIIVDGSRVRYYKEKNYLTIQKVRGNIEVKTLFGLGVLWDGESIVKVLIPKTFSNSPCGLCGNYNDKFEDDTVCGPGCPPTAGNLTKNEALFSESWIASKNTGPINCSPDQPQQVDDLCFYPRRFVQAEINALMSTKTSVFQECLKQKKPDHLRKLREKFEYDLCHAEKDLDKEICRVAEILAWDCLENEEIPISGWASRIRACEEKPRCPNNMVHRTSPNATFPVRTCDNETENVDESQECFCQQGQVLEGDRCIKPEQCGCFYKNGYLAAGDFSTQADCSKIECQGKNVTRQLPAELSSNEECAMVDGLTVVRCEKGYIKDENNQCIHIDECDYAVSNCDANSECVNAPGTYQCECCAGFTKDKSGACQRDEAVGQITKKCCACHGKKCKEYGVVCGTDGKTYPSYKSLYVAACRANNDQLTVNYKGSCKDKCLEVTCSKQYAVCTEVAGIPQCKCPACRNSTYKRRSEMVCASNRVTYSTRCHMEAATCKADIETTVKVESVGKPCLPPPKTQETSWGAWSACSERCKPGNKTRSRTGYSNITQSYVQETQSETCYGTCTKGPCYPRLCRGPGQVCVVTTDNTASCQCPACENSKQEFVCGHECLLQKMACEESQPLYKVLERRACETRPVDCDVVRNFQVYQDDNGCQSSGEVNLGKCDGGCENVKDQCCIATEFAKQIVTLVCPKGVAVDKELVSHCDCCRFQSTYCLALKTTESYINNHLHQIYKL